jgi:ubiquinone/menaquinone biosynthesis C-methylase UbiE
MGQAWRLEDVAGYWDAVAARYLELFRDELRGKPYDLAVLERFATGLGPGARVCDVGCGPCGHVTRVLADHKLALVGIDLSTDCIALARREQPTLRFDVMDMAALAFGDATLEGLVAYYSLHYQPRARVRSTLREWARVLQPQGRLLIVAKEGDSEGWIADPLGSGRPVFWCGFSADELRDLIAACGFDVVDCATRASLAGEIASRRIYLTAERNGAPVR